MGKPKSYLTEVSELSAAERIERAKHVIKDLTYRVNEVIMLHTANQRLVYSDVVSSQIPRSYAASTFNAIKSASHQFEIIRLLALWERASDNAISIPHAIMLLDDPAVIDQICAHIFDHHANSRPAQIAPHEDPNIQAEIERGFKESQSVYGLERVEKARSELAKQIELAKAREQANVQKRLRNLRNHLAHSLSQTRAEQKEPIDNAKYGDEFEVYSETLQIIEVLYQWVNGTGYDIRGEISDNAERCAEEFFGKMRFDFD